MGPPIEPLDVRVSRRELAQHAWVWRSTWGMYLLFGASILLIGLALPEFGSTRVRVLGGALLVWAALLAASGAPAVGTRRNQFAVAGVWTAVAVGMYAFQPGGAAAAAAAMFIGPNTAVRLIDRRHILAHFALASLALLVPSALGLVDRNTLLAALTLIPAIWVLGLASMVVLEAAEAQGDLLEQLVRRDPLTGVGNRRLLEERLTYELARHRRAGTALTVLTFDFNGFKALNDTQGHAAGDELLCDAARRLERCVRAQDTVVRQGGDEFCIVLPETRAAQAERTIIAVRDALSELTIAGKPLTTGVGVAEFPGDAADAASLLEVADGRLLEDKLLLRMQLHGRPHPERRS